MMELVFIPKSKIRSVWPLVHDLIKQGLRHPNRRMDIPSIKKMTMDGDWHMWVIWDNDNKNPRAVFFTEIYEEISGLKIGTMRFFSGRDRNDWKQLLSTLEENMRNAGVQRMEIWARRGWLRELPEYKLTHVLLEKDLDDGIGQVEADQQDTERPVRTSVAGAGISAPPSGPA